jgi:hypothetical protein
VNRENATNETCAIEEAKEIEKRKSDKAAYEADIEKYRKLRAQWIEEGWEYNSQSKKFTKIVDGQVQEREMPIRFQKF